jgi:hypothetical protein
MGSLQSLSNLLQMGAVNYYLLDFLWVFYPDRRERSLRLWEEGVTTLSCPC